MINSSFPKVADQVISFNKNLVDILSKLDNLTTTTESSVNLQIYDEEGVLKNFSLPSFTSLKADIDRLNNNINSLYSIDADGSMIQTSNSNKFKKIITVDLNREPLPVNTLGGIINFKSKVNWFFDSLVDPMMQVEIDLSEKIEENVGSCLINRYIINFEKDENNQLTVNGQSALNSFNELFRGNSNIILSDFKKWHRSTPGVLNPLNPKYDEDIYSLEPNNVLYDGEFSVLKIQEDSLNRKLWYVLSTLEYKVSETEEIKQLSIDDEVIVNSKKTSTRYKVIEISNTESDPRVRFERIEGLEAISVGVKTLKIYSPIIYTKKVKVNIGYNERNVIFLKPINTDNNLVAKKWSLGTGLFTNDLRVSSNNDTNGLTMEQFYTDYVYDYGKVLKDLAIKKIPNNLGVKPNPPSLNRENFKVSQINKHLTDTPDSDLIKQKRNYQSSLKSEISQIEESIIDRNKKIKITRFKSASSKKQSRLELDELSRKKESRNKLLTTVTQEIIDLSRKSISKAGPKFRVRGFWNFPEPISAKGTLPQEIIQFKVQFRYVNVDGTETNIEQYKLENQRKASFSNWKEYKSGVRKRVFDEETSEYFWEIEDLEDPESPNINQIDISIRSGEIVEFRVKSISEVGWPDSSIESDWSEIISIPFPSDLDTILNENESIIEESKKEDVRISLNNDLKAKGLDDHLSDMVKDNNKTYHHSSEKILSGFKDNSSGIELDLFEYLKSLEEKIKSLEERISKTRGILEVTILRNNKEYKIDNGSETIFNIECEDYLEKFSGNNIPSGRVYENNIYVIRDFVIRIRNTASESKLGLLSDKLYSQNSNFYNKNAPQCFWVNEQDELLKSDITSRTRTQLNNQFIWMVNYDSVTDNTVSKLSENIGNSFIDNDSNSLTDILSSSEYNIGFNETNILSFIGNNNSLLDPSKWIDDTTSVDSTTKLLTSIHPVVKDLESIVETNSSKIKSIGSNQDDDIIIPINIYFKMNSLDTNQTGSNYEYINLNKSNKTVKHIKKIKMSLENESENRPFSFSVKFNMSRSNVIIRKSIKPVNEFIK